MSLVAGVDCSTQATKVLVIDVEDGTVVAEGRAEHEVSGTSGTRETHPDVWWSALLGAMQQTGRAKDVSALSIAGQQHGLVVLDESLVPLRPAQLWNDTRASTDATNLIEALGGARAWADGIGLVPVPSYTVCKWAWLRRVEPEVARSTRAIRLPHDYLTGRLTSAGRTDRGDASGTGWWSTSTERYAEQVLDLPQVRVDPALLPVIVSPGEPAGEVTIDASRQSGLRSGTPVASGTGDNMAAALGLGLEPGVPVVSLGTSGTAYITSLTRSADATGTVAGFADATGRFLPLAATLNCTQAVDRIAGWLNLDREIGIEHTDVVLLPYLDGERTPNLPGASGTVVGMRHHTKPDEILLAAYEGAAMGLVDALELVDNNSSGIDPDAPLIMIGGGAKGQTWRRVFGRLSGRPLQIPDTQELVAIGAGAQATALITGETADSVARRWDTRRGLEVETVKRDVETIERIRRTRQLLSDLLFGAT